MILAIVIVGCGGKKSNPVQPTQQTEPTINITAEIKTTDTTGTASFTDKIPNTQLNFKTVDENQKPVSNIAVQMFTDGNAVLYFAYDPNFKYAPMLVSGTGDLKSAKSKKAPAVYEIIDTVGTVIDAVQQIKDTGMTSTPVNNLRQEDITVLNALLGKFDNTSFYNSRDEVIQALAQDFIQRGTNTVVISIAGCIVGGTAGTIVFPGVGTAGGCAGGVAGANVISSLMGWEDAGLADLATAKSFIESKWGSNYPSDQRFTIVNLKTGDALGLAGSAVLAVPGGTSKIIVAIEPDKITVNPSNLSFLSNLLPYRQMVEVRAHYSFWGKSIPPSGYSPFCYMCAYDPPRFNSEVSPSQIATVSYDTALDKYGVTKQQTGEGKITFKFISDYKSLGPIEVKLDDTTSAGTTSKIVFEDLDIYQGTAISIINEDGTGKENITSYGGVDYQDYSPALSPDGTKVVFTSDRPDGFDRKGYLINVDGTNLKQIFSVCYGTPSFSPDGTKIVVENGGNIVITDLSGKILNDFNFGYPNNLLKLGHIYNPNFSPDGNEIIFMTSETPSTDVWETNIYTFNLNDKKTLKKINSFNDPLGEDDTNFKACYSPDMSKVAFMSKHSGRSEIYIMDLGTGKVTQLTNDANETTFNTYPSFSPSGNKIVYEHYSIFDPFNSGVWIMNIDGSGKKRLSSGMNPSFPPVFVVAGKNSIFSFVKN